MNTIIKVENLGKEYVINHENKEPYTAIRDVLSKKVKNIATETLKHFNKSNRTN